MHGRYEMFFMLNLPGVCNYELSIIVKLLVTIYVIVT